MSNFSIEPYFDPIKQWRYYITNDVAMRMPYDINDPLFLQKVSVLQAEQVKHMVAGSYSQTAAFQDETSANFTANRQAMEKGMNMLGSRIIQVGGMITSSLENGFAAMNYGFTDLSNKAEIANAYLSNINKGMALSNKYSQQLVQVTERLNMGVNQINSHLTGINNNLIALERTLSSGFMGLSSKLSVMSLKLDSILEELKIPETQRERRYHIQEGLKYLAQATKDNDDLYYEDALDEFIKAIDIESKDFFSHYYAGYIYMYSKEHLNVDKAVDHLRRFIHYAKVSLDKVSVRSLWNEGCFHLSLGYYLQKKFPEAIQTFAMQKGDSEKLLLQQAKYLSLGNDTEKQQAMHVITKILDKNPYAVMLLLQDRDVLMNPYLPGLIDHLRNDFYAKVKTLFLTIKNAKDSIGVQVTDDKALLDNYLSQNTYLSAVAAYGHFSGMEKMWRDLKIKMVFVEGGAFQMGESFEQDNMVHIYPKHIPRVTLSDYYIAETVVTQALWKTVMGGNPSHFKGGDLPLEMASWDDCQKFISKLNQLTGKKFRLPTEKEWEYAARGGIKRKGFKYAGSDSIDDVAWYWDNSEEKTHPVKSKQPNELCLYDMSGNVWEWCGDLYNYSQTNSMSLSSGTTRVVRGGSWKNSVASCRVSIRNGVDQNCCRNNIGFRLVLDP